MNLDELRLRVDAGEIDTVLLALCDMQGRLQGKRLTARHFVDVVAEDGAEGCNYLLAVDVEMNTVDGYRMASWDRGYGDFAMRPDMTTLRLGALAGGDGDVPVRPVLGRRVGGGGLARARSCAGQLARLAQRGWSANASTELEFMLFRETYESAWHKGYRDLEPANLYNVDYSLLGTARVEPLIRRIRNSMDLAGMAVENSKGECNLGQHEINFLYADALRTADNHVIYKNGAKEIAAQEGMAISYMAKFNEREGSSCHIHFSLGSLDDGSMVFAEDRSGVRGLPGRPAGVPARADAAAGAQRQLLQALRRGLVSRPRRSPGRRTTAPARCASSAMGRRCGLRTAPAARTSTRIMALSAIVAAGLHGVENELALEPAYEGNAYEAADKPRLPGTLREARDLFAASDVAQAAFGEEVVEHYVHAADVELAAFEAAVTDWERFRGFERL